TKADKLYVYSSGIDGGLPTLTLDTELLGGKQYLFEIGVRVLNNKGFKGVKVLTVYINGKLIFEEFDNRANIDDCVVFFQGLPNTGIFRNINIYKTVSFYDGDKLLSSVKVLRGATVKCMGKLADRGDKLFKGWLTEYGQEWNFDTDCVYLDTIFKAKFQKRTYAVLLMVDDVLYKRLNVSAGESLSISELPEKDGYEFDKWLNEDGGEYDMNTPVNRPITLIASFKSTPKTVSKSQNANTVETPKEEPFSTVYILFSILGLAIVAGEIGIIIKKKHSKR
ncbi:MAG: InlB B-repeat-containing protein, partial [Clostridia bacterium]|nr:InlB B-repeat-containing protein [Clostridia bacterium]